MFRVASAALLILAFTSELRGQSGKTADLDAIVRGVSGEYLVWTVEQLTGVVPMSVGGHATILESRAAGHAHNDVAADYLEERLQRMGLHVENHQYSATGRNVLGFQYGSARPEELLILCAHYDDVAGSPGADDNASGTAAVLEAARVLSAVELPNTVVYAFWDEEEIGLVGSKAYAAEAAEKGIEIRGVLNADMLGWDGDGDGFATIESNDDDLTQTVLDAATTFRLSVIPHLSSQYGRSDHVPFDREGYPALLLIEYTDGAAGSDFNPYYHSPNDGVSNINWDYLSEMTRLLAGTAALLSLGDSGVWVEPGQTASTTLTASTPVNFPNPFDRSTTIAVTIEQAAQPTLRVFDLLGRVVYEARSGTVLPGPHTYVLDGTTIAAGTYTYLVDTADKRWTGVMTRLGP